MRTEIFPIPVLNLPMADIPLEGVTAYLSQAEKHQILFMTFEADIILPEHSHEGQWGIVLDGRIDLIVDGTKQSYFRGDRYFIPKGIPHSGKIYAGYTDITFFDQSNRYSIKQKERRR